MNNTIRSAAAMILATGTLSLMPISAQAQGVASATIGFAQSLTFGLAYRQWPRSYNWSYHFIDNSGFALSETNHGELDVSGFTRDNRRYTAASRSVGDSESSRNSVTYDVRNIFGTDSIALNPARTFSRSQAAAESTGESHYTDAISVTSFLHRVSFNRNGEPLGETPRFWMVFSAQPSAVHMETTVEGHADAFAELKLSFVGTIRNLNSPSSEPVQLRPIVLLEKRIEGNDAFDSPEISGLLALDLPNYTRLGDTHFELSMGLQTKMITYARADPVPEPASLLSMGMGLCALVVRRRRVRTA